MAWSILFLNMCADVSHFFLFSHLSQIRNERNFAILERQFKLAQLEYFEFIFTRVRIEINGCRSYSWRSYRFRNEISLYLPRISLFMDLCPPTWLLLGSVFLSNYGQLQLVTTSGYGQEDKKNLLFNPKFFYNWWRSHKDIIE